MPLFGRLLHLHTGSVPLEDFFTEIVGHLFSTAPDILYAWLEHTNLLDTRDYTVASVSTQAEFSPLAHHLTGSRPDLIIELSDGKQRDVVFVESKIGSDEGLDQLRRYADILAAEAGLGERVLVYITRDYDPKEPDRILQGQPRSTVRFQQLRWSAFYRFLKVLPPDPLVAEIITFMEEQRMAQSNQFNAVDIVALSDLPNAIKLMEETMWGQVSDRFKKSVGPIGKRASALNGISQHGRYLMSTGFHGNWWCGLGYHLRSASLTDYPTARVMLEVAPKAPRRAEILEAMQQIRLRPGWYGHALERSHTWSSVIRERSLRDFLSTDDHVGALQAYFLELLDDLAAIKQEFRLLPWGASAEDGAESEEM